MVKDNFQKIAEFIYFDEMNYLREQTNAANFVNEWIADGILMLQQTDNLDEKYFLLGAIGNCYRILNCTSEAILYFDKCLALAEEIPKKKLVTLIRLGEAYKYNNQHDRALSLFDEAHCIRVNYEISDYEDFIYQHKAKCLIELGEKELAKELLLKTLDIRNRKGEHS